MDKLHISMHKSHERVIDVVTRHYTFKKLVFQKPYKVLKSCIMDQLHGCCHGHNH